MIPNPLRQLSAAQCLDLLATCRIGRVGITLGALPVILPVNFVVFDDGVLLRTAAGTKLDAAVRGMVVAFQADSYDPEETAGWSVLLIGRANEIREPTDLDRARAAATTPWPSAEGELHYVHIRGEQISGRQFGP
jgi:nitroimidazol reductase NimA-like FMN-containing flavoprotein (pyridoxamine 5'-phosphate oxidase superfamily)